MGPLAVIIVILFILFVIMYFLRDYGIVRPIINFVKDWFKKALFNILSSDDNNPEQKEDAFFGNKSDNAHDHASEHVPNEDEYPPKTSSTNPKSNRASNTTDSPVPPDALNNSKDPDKTGYIRKGVLKQYMNDGNQESIKEIDIHIDIPADGMYINRPGIKKSDKRQIHIWDNGKISATVSSNAYVLYEQDGHLCLRYADEAYETENGGWCIGDRFINPMYVYVDASTQYPVENFRLENNIVFRLGNQWFKYIQESTVPINPNVFASYNRSAAAKTTDNSAVNATDNSAANTIDNPAEKVPFTDFDFGQLEMK